MIFQLRCDPDNTANGVENASKLNRLARALHLSQANPRSPRKAAGYRSRNFPLTGSQMFTAVRGELIETSPPVVGGRPTRPRSSYSARAAAEPGKESHLRRAADR